MTEGDEGEALPPRFGRFWPGEPDRWIESPPLLKVLERFLILHRSHWLMLAPVDGALLTVMSEIDDRLPGGREDPEAFRWDDDFAALMATQPDPDYEADAAAALARLRAMLLDG